MVNIHKLKSKRKNITRELAKAYKGKQSLKIRIDELENAKRNVDVIIGQKRLEQEKKRKSKK